MIYTLFRHHHLPDFYCAVPHELPPPSFIQEPVWVAVGITKPDEPRPHGFNEEVARFACQFQNFYTFRERSVLERRLHASSHNRDPGQTAFQQHPQSALGQGG